MAGLRRAGTYRPGIVAGAGGLALLALALAMLARSGEPGPPRAHAGNPPTAAGSTSSPTAGATASPGPARAGTGRAKTQPLVFVTHPTRPALALEWRQAHGILDGSITDWRELGAPGGPLRIVLGPAGAKLAPWSREHAHDAIATRPATEKAAAGEIAQDPNAIGLVASAALSPAVRSVRLAGVDPARDPDRYPLRAGGERPAGEVTTAMAFGDIMTARTVDKIMASRGDFTAPFRLVAPRLAAADLAFGNFEGAMSGAVTPPHGKVTRFVSRPRALEGISLAGVDYLSLANNHSGDFGSDILLETVKRLSGAGIATSGAGANDTEARRPAILERNGVRFAFLSFNAIIGGTPAGAHSPGVTTVHMKPWYPFAQADLDRMIAGVRAAREAADVVVVFPHWGQEYVAEPNDDQRRVAHALVDAGADMVIGSHPHWVQGAEIYRDRLIAYSLGNFVCDQAWSVETQQGAALELTFWGPRLVAATFVPVQIEDWHRPRMVDEASGAAILRRIWRASGEPYRRAG